MKNCVLTLLLIASATVLPAKSYAQKPLSRDSINLALSYGLEAVELNKIYTKLLENQKAEIVILNGLVIEKDIEAELLRDKIQIQKPKSWLGRVWDKIAVFAAGTLLGFLLK